MFEGSMLINSLAALATLVSVTQAGVLMPLPITGIPTCSDRCDRAKCVEPKNCPAGLTWDRCLCCRVCARREGDRCDLGAPLFRPGDDHRTYIEAATKFASNYVHGACGNNLECRVRDDLDEEEQQQDDASQDPNQQDVMRNSIQAPETICVCLDPTPRCGTDNTTYSSLCAINEESNMWMDNSDKLKYGISISRNRNFKGRVKIQHIGPCQSPPRILQPLENHISAQVGTNVMFTCDIVAFPMPQIIWELHRVDGTVRTLPDGDGRISVSSRGASRPDRVTSWLQIIQVNPEHEGDYICKAENGLADEATSVGRLLVAKQHVSKYDMEKQNVLPVRKKYRKKYYRTYRRRAREISDDDEDSEMEVEEPLLTASEIDNQMMVRNNEIEEEEEEQTLPVREYQEVDDEF